MLLESLNSHGLRNLVLPSCITFHLSIISSVRVSFPYQRFRLKFQVDKNSSIYRLTLHSLAKYSRSFWAKLLFHVPRIESRQESRPTSMPLDLRHTVSVPPKITKLTVNQAPYSVTDPVHSLPTRPQPYMPSTLSKPTSGNPIPVSKSGPQSASAYSLAFPKNSMPRNDES